MYAADQLISLGGFGICMGQLKIAHYSMKAAKRTQF
jgi:hypothetical protein